MRLIVMREVEELEDGQLTGTAVFRFPVPAGREAYYARPDAVAQAPATDDTELAAIRSGSYVEHVVSGARYPSQLPLEVLEGGLVQTYNQALADWTASEDGRLRYYASSWDGTAWQVTSL